MLAYMSLVTFSSIGANNQTKEWITGLQGRVDHNTEEIKELKEIRIETKLSALDQQVSFIVKLLWACLGVAATTFITIAFKSLFDKHNYTKMRARLHDISNVTSGFDTRIELMEKHQKEMDTLLQKLSMHCNLCPILAPVLKPQAEKPNGSTKPV
jgi:hypothetical protein